MTVSWKFISRWCLYNSYMVKTRGFEDHVMNFMRSWLSLSWLVFLWSLTLTVIDVQHVAENAKGSLKWIPRMFQLCDVFVKPCGIYTLLQVVCCVNWREFYVHGLVHHKSIINVQRDATLCSLYFILMQDHSTCFGCHPHPSSGVHKTVVTATGTSYMPRRVWEA